MIDSALIERDNLELQQELFALPFNTYQVADIEGAKLWTSNTLKRRFCEAMSDTSKTSPIGPDIKKMVDKDVIIPCFMNKSILRLFLFKVFAAAGDKATLGFYLQNKNKIFLLIDNNITFGFASNKRLADLTIHETMHMACNTLKYRYVNIFKDEFMKYYSAFLKEYFNTKGDISKIAKNYYEFLFREFEFREVTMSQLPKFLESYYKTLLPLKRYSQDDELKFEKKLANLINYIRLYFKDMNEFIRSVRTNVDIFRSLYRGYTVGLKLRDARSLFVQELFFPSEVICVYSETGDLTKVYKAFKSIRV